jgi:hypothetical protein
MIKLEILGYILQTDFQISELDIVFKGVFRFISNFIELGVQYSLNFYVCFDVDPGYSPQYTFTLRDVNDLNKFISLDCEEIFTEIKHYLISSNECDITLMRIVLERHFYRVNTNLLIM